ncbi:MAG: glycosyltransferase family 2 protein [Chloroflexota bacterium]
MNDTNNQTIPESSQENPIAASNAERAESKKAQAKAKLAALRAQKDINEQMPAEQPASSNIAVADLPNTATEPTSMNGANPSPATTNGATAPNTEADTYEELREDKRVVMRHQIALQIDNFRASTDEFEARPQRTYPTLTPVTTPFFSVIVPNYNGVSLLPPLLNALKAQTFRDFEVIVVDDASRDHSVQLLEQEYDLGDLHLRILENRTNQGFAVGCNTGADAARGDYIVLLNSDTEPESDWLAALALSICTHPHTAIFASKMLLFDERYKLHTAGDMLGRDGIPRNRGVWQADTGQFDDQLEIFSGCGGGTAYRKDVWQTLGGFDEDFWMYIEDVDIAFRAQLMGWQAIFVPDARVYHHLTATGGDTLASYYVGRNTIWNIAKNMPTQLLLTNLVLIVGAQIQIALDALMNIRGKSARTRLRGQLDGLLGLPRQLQKRKVIQMRRRVSDEALARKFV